MMPRSVYEEYKTFGVVTPRLYDPVSVLTLDFCGFGDMVATLDPGVIVSELNDIYSAFDRIGEQFGCERIKTIGDAYITVSGMPDAAPDHAMSVANAAIRFLRYLKQRNGSHPVQWQCRIGISTGAVIGSVVGVQKYIYDVFGPAVTRALRIRGHAGPMSVAADGEIAQLVEAKFNRISMGPRELVGGTETEIFRMEAVADQPQTYGSQS
ncbi:adenylate/guanylate cyclase domain-containing protein [Roseibium salinum]|nr:adenylate/guanylate cyclase domain-containing protein [Roseibium salinum]